MLVVMVLLSVMLLGALALARINDVSAIASGNAVYREASLQASEIGVNAAFAAVAAVTNLDAPVGNWYSPQTLPQDPATGLPNTVDWGAVPELPPAGAGDAYHVQYVVERMCNVPVITDPLLQCLIKQDNSGGPGQNSAKLPDEKLEPPSATQYRVTVRVTGPKNTTTFVQSLLTRG
jgi:hypothetical protein